MYKRQVYEREGTVLPERVLESLRKNKVGIKGPITTPVGTGFRSVNVAMRKIFDLYACVRPVSYTHLDVYKRQAMTCS